MVDDSHRFFGEMGKKFHSRRYIKAIGNGSGKDILLDMG